MTTTDFTVGFAVERSLEHAETDAIVQALRKAVFGPHLAVQTRVRDIVADLADKLRSSLADVPQSILGPAVLQKVIAALDRPAREIAADTGLRSALVDWAAVIAPRWVLPLAGHLEAVGVIASLGNGSHYQWQRLVALDTGVSVGALMLTELRGTRGGDQETTATWDREGDGYWLTSPTPGSVKMMARGADAAVAETVVVTARP
ncbi:hypothetical protein ACFWWS_38675, partial [Streptomyces sp. NPDC059083]